MPSYRWHYSFRRSFAMQPNRTTPMKKTLAALSLMAFAFAAAAGPCTTHDKWTGPDKAKHFAAGAVIGSATTLVFKDANIGFAVGAGVGLLKELKDRRSPAHSCSAQDFVVTSLGAAVGAYGTGWIIAPQRGGAMVGYVGKF